ncbi:Complex 1 LYR protein [Penicillium verhagenii]|nr:Complex 1 LYR protein [Penicillium verhagenii]
MARLSGLQRDVLSLYRQCFREIRKKPIVRIISKTMPGKLPFPLPFPALRHRYIPADKGPRAEFQKHLSVSKKDFGTIEYLLRKGQRQLEMYASPGIRNIR